MVCRSLFLFGIPHLEQDGSNIQIERRKSMALLVYLVMNPQRHSRDQLSALFWPNNDQISARANLRRALVDLREHPGEGFLITDRESVQITCIQEINIDVFTFRKRINEFRDSSKLMHPDSGNLELLKEAVSYYQDDFLSGFKLLDCQEFNDWQTLKSDELKRELINVLQILAERFGDLEVYETALEYARRLNQIDEFNEAAHRTLIRLLAESGQRSAAIHQYIQCEALLEKELGISPEEETRSLYQKILLNHEIGPFPS